MSAACVDASGLCAACARRGWLLAELGGVLDCNCRADGRLLDVLALDDDELIAALGGRRREQLRSDHAALLPSEATRPAADVAAFCRHDRRFPRRARAASGVAAVYVRGGADRVSELAARPTVAFVGRTSASDYGIATSASLARSLATAGVTVAAGLLGGIGPAALDGALAAGAPALAVIAGALDTGVPARRRGLCERVVGSGCAIAELPPGTPLRRWTAFAAERLLASLADVALVVESGDGANDLSGARAARALGRVVGAVPGRVSSRASRGPHALLRDGAQLVTCAEDVLDVLYDAGARREACAADGEREAYAGLDPLLRDVLAHVGDGADTPGQLLRTGQDAGELLRALGELELMGLLARGDGARYVLRDPLA